MPDIVEVPVERKFTITVTETELRWLHDAFQHPIDGETADNTTRRRAMLKAAANILYPPNAAPSIHKSKE